MDFNAYYTTIIVQDAYRINSFNIKDMTKAGLPKQRKKLLRKKNRPNRNQAIYEMELRQYYMTKIELRMAELLKK